MITICPLLVKTNSPPYTIGKCIDGHYNQPTDDGSRRTAGASPIVRIKLFSLLSVGRIATATVCLSLSSPTRVGFALKPSDVILLICIFRFVGRAPGIHKFLSRSIPRPVTLGKCIMTGTRCALKPSPDKCRLQLLMAVTCNAAVTLRAAIFPLVTVN